MNTHAERRCQHLKIGKIPHSIAKYYSDLQQDYKIYMKILVEWSGRGHLVWKDDDYTVVPPEVSEKKRQTSKTISDFVDLVAKGGTAATNCYGFLYDNYKPNSKSSTRCSEFKCLEALRDYLNETDQNKKTEKQKTFNEKVAKLTKTLSPELITQCSQKLQDGESLDSVWEEVSSVLGNTNKAAQLVPAVKNTKILPRPRRADSYNYCTALMDMLVSSFNAWIKSSKLHEEETQKLEDKLKTTEEKCPEVCDLLHKFANALDSLNYGLTKKVLRKSVDCIKNNKEAPFLNVAITELKKEQYKLLLECPEQQLNTAYKAMKIRWKIANRKPYISMPKFVNDYQVPFGLTGKGEKFTLSVRDNKLWVKIADHEEFCCQRSHYFSDLLVEKEKNSFTIKFRHKLKTKKKEVFGNWITAKICELKIQKKPNEHYYLYLPYSISHHSHNFIAERFFSTADPELEKFTSLESTMKVGACDLNVSVPITIAKAVIRKGNFTHPIQALDYGSGDFVELPQKLCDNTNTSKEIVKLSNNIRSLTSAIREYKDAMRSNTESIDDETLSWLAGELNEEKAKTKTEIRYQIQKIMKRYYKQAKNLRHKCRANGHNVLSESVRLLELMDVTNSLQSSYDNIHVYEKKKQIYKFKTNDKRANFRKFVGRQYASQLVKAFNGCNVVFVEDLEIDFDSDNNNNSLTRLFAPAQLKGYIKNALNKVGIGCVFVQPAHTSCTDPVSGILGFRNRKKDKESLYVVRDGRLGKIHSDLAAAMNVMLVGLNHSVFPRRFWVNEGVPPSEEDKKRLKKFLKERQTKTVSFGDTKPYTGWVYCTPTGYIKEDEKKNNEAEIEAKLNDLLKGGVKPERFSLTANGLGTYKAFHVKKVLD